MTRRALVAFGLYRTILDLSGLPARLSGSWPVRPPRAAEIDTNTPQTPGMSRAAAITAARPGARKLRAGRCAEEGADEAR